MDKVIVTAIGTIMIVLIYWFFFGKREEDSQELTEGPIDVKVEGGYHPSVIRIPAQSDVTLNITRTDENSCLEEIVFPDYKIKKYLPLGETVTVTLKGPHQKESTFHCGMNMYFGKLIAI